MLPNSVYLPLWDLRGCKQPFGLAIHLASQIRARVFWQLKECNLISWHTLSLIAIAYDQAYWWIEHEQEAYRFLQRLLDLQTQNRDRLLSIESIQLISLTDIFASIGF